MKKITTILTVAGVGTGNPAHITLEALDAMMAADIILVPRSRPGIAGISEKLVHHFRQEAPVKPLYFPMTDDTEGWRKIITSQLEGMSSELLGRSIFFPVIGDVTLYSTAYWLIDAMSKVMCGIDVRFIPGISAHSHAASLSCTFLAMSCEVLTIIPGTASPSKIAQALNISDNIAIYKPSAVSDIESLIDPSKFSVIVRVDHAGDPERERIYYGHDALRGITEYMSVILLKR